jgi:hypothetical protein
MTEKELYRNAMKENMKIPSELSAAEVRKGKMNYGYVRSSGAKIVAVAAVFVIIAGAGIFFAVRSSNNEVNKEAGDITPSAAESIAVTEPAVGSAAASQAEMEQSDLEIYCKFWNYVISEPDIYRSTLSCYESGTARTNADRLYWLSEDSDELPKSGVRASKELSEFFANADEVEFLGSRNSLGTVSTIDPEIWERFYSTDMSSIQIQFNYSAASEKDIDPSDLGFAEYSVIDGSAYVNIHKSDPEDPCNYLYKVTTADGKYPLWDGTKMRTLDWASSESTDSFVETKEDFQSENGSKTYSAISADGRASYNYTVDFSKGKPILHFTDLTVNGTEITDGALSIYLGTDKEWGVKNGRPSYSFEISNISRQGGYTVDFNEVFTEYKADEITSINIVAEFNTTDRLVPSDYELYSYKVRSYIGVEHH